MATSTKLKKGDNVIVITGKDKGKQGKIVNIDRKENRVLVEGVNIITKHVKPRGNNQGGILKQEAHVDASNVMYLHDGKPTRLGTKVVMEEKNGKMKAVKYRVAKTTGEVLK